MTEMLFYFFATQNLSTSTCQIKMQVNEDHLKTIIKSLIRLIQSHSISYVMRRCEEKNSKDCLRSCCDLLKLLNVRKIYRCSQTLNTLLSKKIERQNRKKDQRSQLPKTVFERKIIGFIESEFRKMVSSFQIAESIGRTLKT